MRPPDWLFLFPLYAFAIAAPLSQGAASISVAVLAGAALLQMALPGRPNRLPIARPVLVALVLYLAVHALATLLSPYEQRWDKWQGEMWLKSLLVLVPICAWGRERHLPRIVQIMVVVGAVVGIYGIYQHFTGQDLWRGGVTSRTESLAHIAVGFFGHHLTYGGHVLLLWLCALGWALLGEHTSRRMRALPWACVLLLGLALLWSYARSAQLGAAAGCLVFAFRLPPRRRWIALAAVVVLGALALAIPSVGGRFTQLAQLETESTRLNLWKSSWNAIQAHPWLGCGLGNFGYAMEHFGVDGFYDTKAHSHNDFLMHAVNAGLLGLASALALLVTTVVALWRGCRTMTQGMWLPMAGVACQVGISVGGLFQVFQTDNEVEMVLYFVLGAGLAVVNSATPTPRSAPLPDSPDG